MSTFTNKYINSVLPENLEIINADGDRLYAENKDIYYNYFNENVRWLCGYNNQDINEQIEKEISILKDNPRQSENLYNQVKNVLCQNAGKKYEDLLLIAQNTLEFLDTVLDQNSNKKLLVISKTPNLELQDYHYFYNLLELSVSPKEKLTEEGWSVKNLKTLFKNYKNEISGIVISPILFEQGTFLTNDTLKLLAQFGKKYRLPIIWDESYSCFFKSGTFYLLNQYGINPDFIIFDSVISPNISLNFILPIKKSKKKYLENFNGDIEENLPALVVLHSNLLYIVTNKLNEKIDQISYRMIRKLNALSANVKYRFSIQSRGLIVFLNFSQDTLLNRSFNYLLEKGLILYNNRNNSLLIDPQLILSFRAIDLFVHFLDDFFKNGIKLQVNKSE